MGCEIVSRSKSEAADRACEEAARASRAFGRSVLLVSNYDEAVRAKHLLAERGQGYGVSVETLQSWAADLWEMFGDGRVAVSSVDRALFVRRALRDYREAAGDEAVVEVTPGVERVIARLIRLAPAEVIDADKHPEEYALTQSQRVVVGVAAAARRRMAREGFAEHSRVCGALADAGAARGLHVVVLDCETTTAEDRLLATAETTVVRAVAEEAESPARADELNRLVRSLYRPDFDAPVAPTGAVRFAFPSGAYASSQVLADEICSAARRCGSAPCSVAVGAPDALGAFDALAPRLASRGARVRVAGMVSFPLTPFGRAWTSLLEFALRPGRVDVRRAGDFALSAFSAMGVGDAYKIDARLRGWRGQTVDDALTDLTAWADDDWRDFMSAFAEGDLEGALDAQVRWVSTRMSWPEAFRAQQLRAVEGAKAVHSRAAYLGLSPLDALEVLHEMTMPYEAVVEPDGLRAGGGVSDGGAAAGADEALLDVTVSTLGDLALEPSPGFDVVALIDLDAERYPLKDEETSVDALLQALGVWKPAERVRKLRLRFARSVAQARSTLILHRSLNTSDASELRPAALLEELVDCYRSDPRNAAEVDKVTGLTAPLGEFCASLGEDDLARVADPLGEPTPLDEALPVFSTGFLAPEDRAFVSVSKRGPDGAVLPEPVLSPSAIEVYLECPCKWFASRRLRLAAVDAELGPIAYGNFAHAVLADLHDKLKVTGLRRVTPDNLAECDALLDACFDKLLAEQLTSYKADALIPLTPLEHLNVAAFRDNLHAYLRREAVLCPGFSPLGQEVRFGVDEPFEYAGVRIEGSIDRVDVDGAGRAVVLDYKGSVGSPYCFVPKGGFDGPSLGGDVDSAEGPQDDSPLPRAEGLVLPRKVQTLIYAQVVRKKLGYLPVAALYVSYGKKPGLAGLYDETVLSPATDLPGIDPERCATRDVLGLLDKCEEAVARRLESLFAGEIEPAPCDAEACEYCPVVSCDVRDGAAGRGVA